VSVDQGNEDQMTESQDNDSNAALLYFLLIQQALPPVTKRNTQTERTLSKRSDSPLHTL